jgi:hypothetical protein
MIDFIKTILTALGILGGLATIGIVVLLVFQPNISIVIGSNNNVNQKTQTQPLTTPAPQATIQVKVSPSPESPSKELPKETSSNNNQTKTKPITEPDTPDSNVNSEEEQSYQEPRVARTKRNSTNRPAYRNLNDFYQDTSNNYRNRSDSSENSCTCPVVRTVRPSMPVDTSENYENYQDLRPKTHHSEETETYEETRTINGVTTTTRRTTTRRVTRTSTNRITIN